MKLLVAATFLILSSNAFAGVDSCEYDIRNAVQMIESYTSRFASAPVKLDSGFMSHPYETRSGDVVTHFRGTANGNTLVFEALLECMPQTGSYELAWASSSPR